MHPPLDRALRMKNADRIAFIGAGGKTTALFQLARGLPPPVLVTATSHLGIWQVENADQHIATDSPAPLEALEHGLKNILLVTGELDGNRTKPVPEKLLQWLKEFCGYHAIPLLVEADGSRQKPLKAWAEHEPVIPMFVDSVVQVAGLSALGNPLSEEFVHRPGIYSRLSGLAIGDRLTAEAITQVLTHPAGGLKNMPGQARRLVLLNQADTTELQAAASGMVPHLLTAYDSVVIASLEKQTIYAVHEPVAAIILAAGDSSRYGKVKQLLDWRGQPFIRAVAKTALEAGCSPVIVVTGANADQIELAVHDLNVNMVHNPDWQEGQGSSIRVGIGALASPRQNDVTMGSVFSGVGIGAGFRRAPEAGAAIFLLADQPQITPAILHALVEKHAQELYPIIAPMVMDRRANPVLFDLSTFRDLGTLQGDTGGRAIFHKHKVEYLPWHDDRLLLDVDTPEMYRRLLEDETL